MTELQPIIVFHGRNFVRHLEICNPICVKLLKIMSGVIPRNLEQKRRLYLKLFSWRPQTRHTHTDTHTHTHTSRDTHDDSIRRNAMRCISAKNMLLAEPTCCSEIVRRTFRCIATKTGNDLLSSVNKSNKQWQF